MGKAAARLGDMTAHGTPLQPGLGSSNVLIGGQPAWRGISAAQVIQLAELVKQGTENIAKAQLKALAAKGTPAAIAAEANHINTIIESATDLAKLMASFTADQHVCPVVSVAIPHGSGVVINGSSTVFINGLPACRQGDTIQETTAVNNIAMGEVTVLIGD